MQLSTLEVPKSSHNSYVLSLEQNPLWWLLWCHCSWQVLALSNLKSLLTIVRSQLLIKMYVRTAFSILCFLLWWWCLFVCFVVLLFFLLFGLVCLCFFLVACLFAFGGKGVVDCFCLARILWKLPFLSILFFFFTNFQPKYTTFCCNQKW